MKFLSKKGYLPEIELDKNKVLIMPIKSTEENK